MDQNEESIQVKAGEKVEILNRSQRSVPLVYEFSARAVGQEVPLGRVEIHTKGGLRKKHVKSYQLRPKNAIKVSIWGTFMALFVVAENDLQVTLPQSKLAKGRMIFGLCFLMIILALALIISQS